MTASITPSNSIVIREVTKSLTRSGGGSGVSLHIDADFASQFNLDPGTELTLKAYEVAGDLHLQIEDTPTGFTIDEFQDFASMHDWIELTDEQLGEQMHRTVYVDPSRHVRVSMRSPGHIGDVLINNLSVEGCPVNLTADSGEVYQRMLDTAQQKRFDIEVTDSEGLWQRLKASNTHETDEVPDSQTIDQLVSKVDTVTVQFVWTSRSAEETLENVGDVAKSIKDGLDSLDIDLDDMDVTCDNDDEELIPLP